MFYGWSCGETDYIAMFSTMFYCNTDVSSTMFLAISPFVEEDYFETDEQAHFMYFVLYVYINNACNFIALKCDNFTTNNSIATKLETKFVRCAINRFDLAAEYVLGDHKIIFNSVQSSVVKIHNLVLTAKLKK